MKTSTIMALDILSSDLSNVYCDVVKNHFRIYYANWLPAKTLDLGDYGMLQGNIFIKLGNVKNDFLELKGAVIQEFTEQSKNHYEFTSSRDVEIKTTAKGTVGNIGITANATLGIQFHSENSVFFNAAECTTKFISNKAEIGKIIMNLYRENRWRFNYVLVTDIIKAGRTLIAISSAENSSISFEASSPNISHIDLANASLGLSITSESNIGFKVVSEDGLDLLMGLCKVKNSFPPFTSPEFKPTNFGLNMASLINERMIDENWQTKLTNSEGQNDQDLNFGQLGY